MSRLPTLVLALLIVTLGACESRDAANATAAVSVDAAVSNDATTPPMQATPPASTGQDIIQRDNSAYFQAIAADLRNMTVQQEVYFAENNSYASSVQQLAFTASPGVAMRITAGSATGWAARATHSGLNDATQYCTITTSPNPAGLTPVCVGR